MIIECKTCHARFRLDDSKVKGKGVKVSCRKCGEPIVVLRDAVPASPDSDSGKKESLNLKSAPHDSSPDNLIRFPKNASHPAPPPQDEEKSEIDIAFENLFRLTEETAEPKTASAKQSQESAVFEPPTMVPKFDPLAELTFETKDTPDFNAFAEEQEFDIPAEPPLDKPESHPFQDESFDIASEIITRSPAMDKQQTSSFENDLDFLKEFETQNLPDFQVSVGESTPDMPTEFQFDEPDSSAFQNNAFDMASELITEPPEQHITSSGDDIDFLKEFETQNPPDFQESAEEPTFDAQAEFRLDTPESSAFEDDIFSMTPEAETGLPVMEEQQTTPYGDDDFFKKFEAQSMPDFQVSESSALEEDAFDMAPEITTDPFAMAQQQAQSPEADDYFKEFKEQVAKNFQAPKKEEPAFDMPEDFQFEAPEPPSFYDNSFDTAPEATTDPFAMAQPPEADDYFKEFKEQVAKNFHAPEKEEPAFDMSEDFQFETPEPPLFDSNAFDATPEVTTDPPATPPQAQSPEEDDVFKEFEAHITKTFQEPEEKEPLLDMLEDFQLEAPEPPLFDSNAFDAAPEAATGPPATLQQAQSTEEDDVFKEFEAHLAKTFQEPEKEEPALDLSEDFQLRAPDPPASDSNASDTAPKTTTGPPAMKQQAQSPEEDDAFKEIETHLTKTFQAPEEEPALDTSEDFQFRAPDPPAFTGNSFDSAPETATAPSEIKEKKQPEPSAGQHDDISAAIASKPPELQIERTAFDAPDEASMVSDASDMAVEGNETPSYVYTPDAEPEPAAVPYANEENLPAETPEQIYAATKPPKPSAKRVRASSGSRFFRVAKALFLLALLGTAGYYFGFNEQGRRYATDTSLQLIAMFNDKILGKTSAPASQYEVTSEIAYYDSGESSQRIFVIRGNVTNQSLVGKSGIRIHASLLDINESVLMEQTVYAGNVLSGPKLKSESRAALEKALGNHLGEYLANVDVKPGKTIPFMVLFFDAPEKFRKYKIEPLDSP
ncbi:MAG: zinc-ribbon domain-containing protein [Syntrophorhabdaceae bacterium]|nr:zinc-ribbon domain-containing protein [Syntrophorhabdaceae bacterium]